MSQFGKHIFGTSFFGRTSTFDGKYETVIIDANDLFSGSIGLSLKATLPPQTYAFNDKQITYNTSDWTATATAITTNKTGAILSTVACGDKFTINAIQKAGGATATVVLTHTETNTVSQFTINTSTQSSASLAVPYGDYFVKLTTGAGSFNFTSLTVGVTQVGIEVRTASALEQGIPLWDDFVAVPLAYDALGDAYVGNSGVYTNRRYIQARIHMTTSDSDKTPFVDSLNIFSGDLGKYQTNGFWRAALNFNNIATDKSVVFKRAKRVFWTEAEQPNSELTIRSTSVTSSTQITIPSRNEILSASYWKAETAPYYLLANGTTAGTPTDRISLAEKNNGFVASSTIASVLKGPINTQKYGLANSTVRSWLAWYSQHGFPTNQQNVSITMEFYENVDDIQKGIAPVFTVNQKDGISEGLIYLAEEDKRDYLFLRLLLKRPVNGQSPVVDQINLTANVHYQSSNQSGIYTATLSPMDYIASQAKADMGHKRLPDINSDIFNWPSNVQHITANTLAIGNADRIIAIDYHPVYQNQVFVGFNETLNKSVNIGNLSNQTLQLFAEIYCKEPQASTLGITGDQLYWHYSYDGGTVNYPIETTRDLSSQYTPTLVGGTKYRFMLESGWQDETFELPYSMTWSELEDIVDYKQTDIELANNAIKLYDGRIPAGYTVFLPNDSLNEKIAFKFFNTSTRFTESANDKVVAWIPTGGDYQYADWVSEEVIYDGIINVNDSQLPYVRTQFSTRNQQRELVYQVTDLLESAQSIADKYHVNVQDIILANNNKTTFSQNEKVQVPGAFMLPEIIPDLIYDGTNPYVIEIIPGSVYRTSDKTTLPETTLIPGSDDEPAIQYTLRNSEVTTVYLTRGEITHGSELIPLSNLVEVVGVINMSTGYRYVPYSRNGTAETGDYIIKDNRIDWSPTHTLAKEPAEGQMYGVSLIYGKIDSLKIIYTSDYVEKMAQDRLWRSKETMEFSGVASPGIPVVFDLPAFSTFTDYNTNHKQVNYIVEDNDLWVTTKITNQGEQYQLVATMEDDPRRNWYPTINTGFYYLGSQEYYLYSEPVRQTFTEKEVPIIADVDYSHDGMKLR